MASLSQFFGGSKGGQSGGIGQYGVGLATGFTSQLPIDLMLIGGGGGGGGAGQQAFAGVSTNIPLANADRVLAGGGGAGRGLIYTNLVVDVGTTYPITVGAGGAENSRGGTSSFGFIRAGGGGSGGGVTPTGVAVTPDFGGLYGGHQGGPGIINSTPDDGGGVGVAPFIDSIYSVVDIPINNSPYAGPILGGGGLFGANNFFKQAINSQVINHAVYSYIHPAGAPVFSPNAAEVGAGGGAYYIGASGTPLVGVTEPQLFGRWGLPTFISPAPRAQYTSALTPVNASPNYAPVSFIAFGVFSGIANPSGYSPVITGFPGSNSISVLNSPIGGRVGQYVGPGIGSMGRWFWTPNIPAYNTIQVTSPTGAIINRLIPITGGNFRYSSLPGSPFSIGAGTSQTDKTVTYNTIPSYTGSPGNGGGGGGGLRHPPVIMQGTATQPYTGPAGGFDRNHPYVFTVPGSTAPMASGGAGGSGSVWVIYPSDYAAATVTGNTPVPSPPAIRVYRWDGAGTIKFNAS